MKEELHEFPHRFDLFEALRWLQSEVPDLPRIGESRVIEEDAARFGQIPFLYCAAAAIHSFDLEDPEKKRAARMMIHSFGLLGPNGPMPLSFTEYVWERTHQHRDKTLLAFLNIFHHRLVSLFFRAWAESRKTLDYDRPSKRKMPKFIGSTFGMGCDSLWNRDRVPDDAKLFFAGWLSGPSKCAEGIGSILQTFFGVPTHIQPFVGRWLGLPQENRCRLGESSDTGTMGSSLILGERIWDVQLTFRVVMGPMKLEAYERLLPSGSSFGRMKDWIRNYLGDELMWELQMVLEKDEVPQVQLGVAGRLGWTTWLKSQPFTQDASDLLIQQE